MANLDATTRLSNIFSSLSLWQSTILSLLHSTTMLSINFLPALQGIALPWPSNLSSTKLHGQMGFYYLKHRKEGEWKTSTRTQASCDVACWSLNWFIFHSSENCGLAKRKLWIRKQRVCWPHSCTTRTWEAAVWQRETLVITPLPTEFIAVFEWENVATL